MKKQKIIIQCFALCFKSLICTQSALNTYSVYLSGLKAETDPRSVYSWLVLWPFMQIWGSAEFLCYFFQLLNCCQSSLWIKHLLKYHLKTWKVPSNCPIVCFVSLVVCCVVLSPSYSFKLGVSILHFYEPERTSVSECSMSVMTCKSFWWPQTL